MITMSIYRIITTQAVRNIYPLFKSELDGPFIIWKQYPQDWLNTLYNRWKNYNFKFTCPEEQVKAAFELHIQRRYNDWMSEIRNSVFKKHKNAVAWYANNSSWLKPEIYGHWWSMNGWEESGRLVIYLKILNTFIVFCSMCNSCLLWMKFVGKKWEKC